MTPEKAGPDSAVARIAGFVCGFSAAAMSDEVVHEFRRRFVDSMGCGLAGYREPVGRTAREFALRGQPREGRGSHVLGTKQTTLPELAAFANGTMVRCLDGNDTLVRGGGHPSDIIPAILAMAEDQGCDGRTFMGSVVAAYEVYHHVHQATLFREKGWDYGHLSAVGAAAGIANLLRYGVEKAAHALSIAITANHALLVTRRGTASQWRSCASPHAAANGLVAAMLAGQEVSAPGKPVEGNGGLKQHFPPFELASFDAPGTPRAITITQLKSFLCEYHAQGLVSAALELSPQVDPGTIESIRVFLYGVPGLDFFTRSDEVWHPQTRETADHSMPFLVSATLIDGTYNDAIFSEERIRDPAIHALCDRITVLEDPAYTPRFPEASPSRVEIRLTDGSVKTAAVEYPRGHYRNPMTDREISEKFIVLAGRAMPQSRAEQSLSRLWKIDTETDLAGLMRGLHAD